MSKDVKQLYPRDEVIAAVEQALQTDEPGDLFGAFLTAQNPTEYEYVRSRVDVAEVLSRRTAGSRSLPPDEQVLELVSIAKQVLALLGDSVAPLGTAVASEEQEKVNAPSSTRSEDLESSIFVQLGREIGTYVRYAREALDNAGHRTLPLSAVDGLGVNDRLRSVTGYDCFSQLEEAIAQIEATLKRQHRAPKPMDDVYRPGMASALFEFQEAVLSEINKVRSKRPDFADSATAVLRINFGASMLLLGDPRGYSLLELRISQADQSQSRTLPPELECNLDRDVEVILPFSGFLDHGVRRLLAGAACQVLNEDNLEFAHKFSPLLLSGQLSSDESDEDPIEHEHPTLSNLAALLMDSSPLETPLLLDIVKSIDPNELDTYLDDEMFASVFYSVQSSWIEKDPGVGCESLFSLSQFGRVQYLSQLEKPVWSIWMLATLLYNDDVMYGVPTPERWNNYAVGIDALIRDGYAALAEALFIFYLFTHAGRLISSPDEVLQRLDQFSLLARPDELWGVEKKLREAGRSRSLERVLPALAQVLKTARHDAGALATLRWAQFEAESEPEAESSSIRIPMEDFLTQRLEQIVGAESFQQLPKRVQAMLVEAEKVFETMSGHGRDPQTAIWIVHYQALIERLFSPLKSSLWTNLSAKLEAQRLLPELENDLHPTFSSILRLLEKIVQTGNKKLLDFVTEAGGSLPPMASTNMLRYIRETVLPLRNSAAHGGEVDVKQAYEARLWLLKNIATLVKCLPDEKRLK